MEARMVTKEDFEGQKEAVETVETIKPATFVDGGAEEGAIQLRISLAIIERFSEGLYSSPQKAFEELVANSYDAGAERVWIQLPPDPSKHDTIVVIDDGESMDYSGLSELWYLARSPKRTGGPNGGERIVRGRRPIGKFGIGKLATYVLAEQLTYICRKGEKYLAVTMDFGRVRGSLEEPQQLALEVVNLSAAQAERSLRAVVTDKTALGALFGSNPPAHWTAAILTSLRPKAQDIKIGRLKWVLSTALPLNPGFSLWCNGDELESAKQKGERIWTWTIGESDTKEKRWRYTAATRTVDIDGKKKTVRGVELGRAGFITGMAELFVESLQRGKSEEWDRSHGFFVKVRGRLVNIGDTFAGITTELHHGTFTRFRMVVEADGLDDYIASPRESFQESAALDEFRRYLLDVFNRARSELQAYEDQPDKDVLAAAERIADAPPALSTRPLKRLLRAAVDGDTSLVDIFGLTDDADREAARKALEAGARLLEKVEIDTLPDPHRLVGFDASRRAIIVNASHPFVRNHLNTKGGADVVRDLGAAELLTEAFMLDQDFPSHFVRQFLERRDALLRALTRVYPKSAPVIAQHLRDAHGDERALEDAVADALELMGYDVTRIGGRGKPDGLATARLGRRGRGTEKIAYSFTYDAKSITSGTKEAIQAGAARTSILRVHRERMKADHTLLVAPGFEGAADPTSNLGETCVNDKITPITIKDLARLVELFPLRIFTPESLRSLFDCHLPSHCTAYVDALAKREPPTPPPIVKVLEIIAEVSLRQDAVSVDTVNTVLNERYGMDLGSDAVDAVLRALAAMAPTTVWYEDSVVSLNASVQAVQDEIQNTIAPLPNELADAYRASLGTVTK